MDPLYTTVASVKERLKSKVQFQSGNEPIDGEVSNDLLCQIIGDAETDVESALRTRYAIPFQSILKGNYAGLPDHSKRVIRKLVDYRTAIILLSVDFGRGSHIDGDPYLVNLKHLYKSGVFEALGKDPIGNNKGIDRFKYSPPLEDMKLARTNSKADDGYRGTVINTDASCGGDAASYAEGQINNPALSWQGGRNGNGVL